MQPDFVGLYWMLMAGAVSGFGLELKLAHAPFAFLTTNTTEHWRRTTDVH